MSKVPVLLLLVSGDFQKGDVWRKDEGRNVARHSAVDLSDPILSNEIDPSDLIQDPDPRPTTEKDRLIERSNHHHHHPTSKLI